MTKRAFKVRKRKVIFSKGPIHLVDCDVEVRGQLLSRQILEHPGSVVILPRPRPGKLILIRQFRFAVGDWLWEFPAGGVEKGETLRQAASRELMEEIGMRPRSLVRLGAFYPTPGVSGEQMHLFLAKRLVPEFREGDEDEEIEKATFSMKEIEIMIRRAKICDAKTILGFQWLRGL